MNILSLPLEMLSLIMSKMDNKTWANIQLSNSVFYSIVTDAERQHRYDIQFPTYFIRSWECKFVNIP